MHLYKVLDLDKINNNNKELEMLDEISIQKKTFFFHFHQFSNTKKGICNIYSLSSILATFEFSDIVRKLFQCDH